MDVVLSNGVYRQHLADHAGTVIIHCHWLSHEDLGCMSQFTIGTCATDDVANGILGTCSTDVHVSLNFLVLLANELGWAVWIVTTLFVLLILGGTVGAIWCYTSKKKQKKEGVLAGVDGMDAATDVLAGVEKSGRVTHL